MSVTVSEDCFEAGAILSAFNDRNKGAGGVVTFVGNVRETGPTSAVVKLHLEHYPGVTEASIAKIEQEAFLRWPLLDCEIIHRVGDLTPGEPIVLVCVAAAHRREAFEAADFIMDYLKTEAMFWKKEIRTDEETWIEPRQQDYQDADRWRKRKGD